MIEKIDVTLCGVSFKVDPEESWREFRAKTFEEQLETVCEDFHWIVQLHQVDLPQNARESFWVKYREPSANRARQAAVHSLCWVNYKEERDLLNGAIQAHEQMLEDCSTEPWKKTLGEQVDSFGFVGLKFAKLVAAMDHKAFSRMAAIIERGGTPSSDNPRGGEDSEAGQIYREFCQFHVNTRSLPTKKQLRNASGIGDESEDLKRAGKIMKKLGLDGLPAGKSP